MKPHTEIPEGEMKAPSEFNFMQFLGGGCQINSVILETFWGRIITLKLLRITKS